MDLRTPEEKWMDSFHGSIRLSNMQQGYMQGQNRREEDVRVMLQICRKMPPFDSSIITMTPFLKFPQIVSHLVTRDNNTSLLRAASIQFSRSPHSLLTLRNSFTPQCRNYSQQENQKNQNPQFQKSTSQNTKKSSPSSESSPEQQNDRVYLPKHGQSTGDAALDDAIRKWRQTNTPQDEKFRNLYQKSEAGLVKSLMERSEDPPEAFSARPTINSSAEYEDSEDSTAQPSTQASGSEASESGEINGPKGPEPTRYGDWERKGRTFDF